MELYDDPEPRKPNPERHHGQIYWLFWHVAEWFMEQPASSTEADPPKPVAEEPIADPD